MARLIDFPKRNRLVMGDGRFQIDVARPSVKRPSTMEQNMMMGSSIDDADDDFFSDLAMVQKMTLYHRYDVS